MNPYTTLFGLTGRTAVVTGGAGILDAHFCEGLAAFGANVVVIDREKSKAKAVAAKLPVYSASKASFIGLTTYLASYWAAKVVQVNALTPGGVESGQNDIFKKITAPVCHWAARGKQRRWWAR